MYSRYGQAMVNYKKSNIIFIGERNIDNLIIERVLRCKTKEFPITYLGVPLRDKKLKKEDWIGLIERARKRLKGWQDWFLLLGGRKS